MELIFFASGAGAMAGFAVAVLWKGIDTLLGIDTITNDKGLACMMIGAVLLPILSIITIAVDEIITSVRQRRNNR